jgi:hypothetical protein
MRRRKSTIDPRDPEGLWGDAGRDFDWYLFNSYVSYMVLGLAHARVERQYADREEALLLGEQIDRDCCCEHHQVKGSEWPYDGCICCTWHGYPMFRDAFNAWLASRG